MIYLCFFENTITLQKINVRKYQGIIKKIDNPENLTTYGTQDEDKQNKNTTQ